MANRPTYVWTGSEWDTIADPGAARSANPTFTGVAQFPDGSASAPSITNTGDTNTGIFHPADDTVAVTTGGSERVRVNSSGQILVNDTTARTVANVSNHGLQIFGGGPARVTVIRGSNDTNGAAIFFAKSRNATAGSSTAVQSGDFVGSLRFNADDGTDLNSEVARIDTAIDGAPAANNTPGRITFWTTPAGSDGATERMRIDSTGRVQIPAGGVLEAPLVQNARTDSYTLVLADAGKLIEMGKATAQTLTIPTNASVAFPVGTKIDVIQTGAGETTIAGAGVTINSEGSKLKLNAQWAAATLIKRATDTWVVIGSLKA